MFYRGGAGLTRGNLVRLWVLPLGVRLGVRHPGQGVENDSAIPYDAAFDPPPDDAMNERVYKQTKTR